MLLARFGIRELWRTRGQTLVLTLVLGLLASVLGGGLSAPKSMLVSRQGYHDRLALADLEVHLKAELLNLGPTVAQLEELSGVASAERRFVIRGTADQPEGEPFPIVLICTDPQRQRVNKLQLLEGEPIQAGEPQRVLIDRSYAASHQLSPGDAIRVQTNGLRITLEVGGVVMSPEFLVPTANPNMLSPPKGSLGIVFGSLELMEIVAKRTMFRGPLRRFVRQSVKPYNSLVFKFEPSVDRQQTTAAILSALDELEVEMVVPQQNNPGVRFLDEDLAGFYIFVFFSSLIYAGLAAIVAIVTVNRLVSAKTRELATMLALGFAPRQIAFGVVMVTVIPAVIAGALGVGGAHLFARVLVKAYEYVLGLPPMQVSHATRDVIIISLAPIAVVVVASFWPLLRLWKLSPMSALRGAAQVRFIGLPRWLDPILIRGAPLTRFALRNVLRRPQISLAAVLLLSFCIALPAAFLALISSRAAWTEALAANIGYDAIVTLQDVMPADEAADLIDLSGVTLAEPFLVGTASISRADHPTRQARLVGLPVPRELQGLALVDGSDFTAAEANEVTLNQNFLHGRAPPVVGETVRLATSQGSRELQVVGVVSEPSFQTVYLPIGVARELLQQPDGVSGYALRLKAGQDLQALAQQYRSLGGVESFQSRAVVTAGILAYIDSFREMVLPILAVCVLQGLLFLVMLFGILLLERHSEYAVLRSMGTSGSSLTRSVFIEVGILAVGGSLLALPVWAGLSALLRAVMRRAWVDPGSMWFLGDFAQVALVSVTVLLLAVIPAMIYVLRIPIMDMLRVRDFG